MYAVIWLGAGKIQARKELKKKKVIEGMKTK
jgi:hypothetical protein